MDAPVAGVEQHEAGAAGRPGAEIALSEKRERDVGQHEVWHGVRFQSGLTKEHGPLARAPGQILARQLLEESDVLIAGVGNRDQLGERRADRRGTVGVGEGRVAEVALEGPDQALPAIAIARVAKGVKAIEALAVWTGVALGVRVVAEHEGKVLDAAHGHHRVGGGLGSPTVGQEPGVHGATQPLQSESHQAGMADAHPHHGCAGTVAHRLVVDRRIAHGQVGAFQEHVALDADPLWFRVDGDAALLSVARQIVSLRHPAHPVPVHAGRADAAGRPIAGIDLAVGLVRRIHEFVLRQVGDPLGGHMRVHVGIFAVAVAGAHQVLGQHVRETQENRLGAAGVLGVFAQCVGQAQRVQLAGHEAHLLRANDAGNARPSEPVTVAAEGLPADEAETLLRVPLAFEDNALRVLVVGKNRLAHAAFQLVRLPLRPRPLPVRMPGQTLGSAGGARPDAPRRGPPDHAIQGIRADLQEDTVGVLAQAGQVALGPDVTFDVLPGSGKIRLLDRRCRMLHLAPIRPPVGPVGGALALGQYGAGGPQEHRVDDNGPKCRVNVESHVSSAEWLCPDRISATGALNVGLGHLRQPRRNGPCGWSGPEGPTNPRPVNDGRCANAFNRFPPRRLKGVQSRYSGGAAVSIDVALRRCAKMSGRPRFLSGGNEADPLAAIQ